MKFKKIFKSIDEANTYFKPTSPYLTKVVDHIFSDRQTICNGTISKIDFYNIVATVLDDITLVQNSYEAVVMVDYTLNQTLGYNFYPATGEIAEYGDEILILIGAIYMLMCHCLPQYEKEWQLLYNTIHTYAQEQLFNQYISNSEIERKEIRL